MPVDDGCSARAMFTGIAKEVASLVINLATRDDREIGSISDLCVLSHPGNRFDGQRLRGELQARCMHVLIANNVVDGHDDDPNVDAPSQVAKSEHLHSFSPDQTAFRRRCLPESLHSRWHFHFLAPI